MRRFALALLLALYVGLAPFALGHRPLAAFSTVLAMASILYLVRKIAGEPLARG